MPDTPAMDPARIKTLQRPFFDAFTPRFRGTVWENARRFRLIGKAYESMPPEQGGHFDIASCRHLAGPMVAWKHPDIRKILVRKAIQTQGSLIIDLILPYIMEHEPRNTLLLFETDPKALNYCSVRLMDTLHRHPVIGPKIRDVEQVNRFNVTTTYIKLPDMVLMVGGLNDSNVASLSWPNILISEAWFHKSDGLLFKAFGRTTQFENNCKILVESQAGLEGEDFARECDAAARIPLTWACPFCEHRQEFEFTYTRPDDFKPRKRIHFSEGELPMDIEPKPGTYAGMIIPPGTRMIDGVEIPLSTDERANGSEWECQACGGRIKDTRAMRQKLMDSYQQIIPNPAPRSVLFDWPEEASLGISFAESVRHFLVADAAQKQGNIVPKQDWYMQRRAITWNPQLTRPVIEVSPGSYDPKEIIPNEHSRNGVIDCQEDPEHKQKTGQSITGHFWYIFRVIDKMGNSKQLARGYAKSWQEWIDVQQHWKVPNDRILIDIGQWPQQIMMEAAQRREIIKIEKPLPPFYLREKSVTWYLISAENRRISFKHRDGQVRPWSEIQPVSGSTIDKDGKIKRIPLKKIRFDKMAFQLQLDAIRSGAPGMAKFEFLDKKYLTPANQQKESGNLSYKMQMEAQSFDQTQNKYLEIRADDHYSFCEQGHILRMAIDGLLGHLPMSETKPE